MRKKAHPKHDKTPIPHDLVEFLKKEFPEFRQESSDDQEALARMLWVSPNWRRQHKHFENALTFSHSELDSAFGRRKFKAVNDRVGFFDVTPNWSKDKQHTKGYTPTDKVRDAFGRYLKKRRRKDVILLIGNGAEMKYIPNAVAAKDSSQGEISTKWNHYDGNVVKVDLENLKNLVRWTEDVQADIKRGGIGNLFALYPPMRVIDDILMVAGQIIKLTQTKLVGRGHMMQRYREAPSGRLFAKDVNLQNAPSLVKEAAFHGLWEYDFSNCHYAILRQMAARFGYECQAIDHYVENKPAVRRQIADQARIHEAQAKECLLMLLYGASQSDDPKLSIPEAIGSEAAQRFHAVDLVAGIANDIAQARKLILKGWKINQRGGLTNEFGKTINPTGLSKPQLLAHLTQGAEAFALHTATKMYDPKVIPLLQHDGFVATRKLPVWEIEQEVERVTGYSLGMEMKIIQINPEAYFLKNSNQSENG